MNKIIIKILISVILFFHCPFAHAQKFAPPEGKRLFIIGQDYDTDNLYLSNMPADLSLPAGFSLYTNVTAYLDPNSEAQELVPGLVFQSDMGAGPNWAQGHVNDHPQTVLLIAVAFDWEVVLDNILAGKSDSQIEYLAQYIKSIQRPVFLRIGYEADNEWHEMNWGGWERARSNAQKYKAAYNYLASKLRDEYGVDNVAFVWHCMAGKISVPTENPYHPGIINPYVPEDWLGAMEWYPGDSYVDWVAISYFRFFVDTRCDQDACCIVEDKNIISLAQEFLALKARDLDKPFMIAESGPAFLNLSENPIIEGKEVWEYWFEPYFDFIETYNVKAFTYINSYWDSMPRYADCVPVPCKGINDERQFCWGDSRIQANNPLEAKWVTRLRGPDILHSSDQLYDLIGFTPDSSKTFIRGDANGDGRVDISDAISVLIYLFREGETPGCLDAVDANDDGRVDISDAIKILRFLFGGQQMPLPNNYFGIDPTPDSLGCGS